MAQITISDDLMQCVRQYAQQTGKTPEDVVQEALVDLFVLSGMPAALADIDAILPPYGSQAEQQVLDDVRTRVGNHLAAQGISIADEIGRDRGE